MINYLKLEETSPRAILLLSSLLVVCLLITLDHFVLETTE